MLTRRALLGGLAGGALIAPNVSAAAPRTVSDSDGHDYPLRMRRNVEILYQSPDGNPNGLEATPEGLWVGEQITDRAYLLDWETGRPLTMHETQSSNTSGIAAGGGSVFMAANGPPILRDRRPHDLERGGRIVKLDAKTGKHVKNYTTPNGGGLHGLLWAQDSLWITQFRPNAIVRSRRRHERFEFIPDTSRASPRPRLGRQVHLVHVLGRFPRAQVRCRERTHRRGGPIEQP